MERWWLTPAARKAGSAMQPFGAVNSFPMVRLTVHFIKQVRMIQDLDTLQASLSHMRLLNSVTIISCVNFMYYHPYFLLQHIQRVR